MSQESNRTPTLFGGEVPRSARISNDLVFQAIREARKKYFVEYVPARAGAYFASLALIFLVKPESSEIANSMERECNEWIQRYPVPLMVTAFDDTDSVISLAVERGCDYLTGIIEDGEAVYYWKLLENGDFPSGRLWEEHLKKVYNGIPFSTGENRCSMAISSAKSIRLGLIMIAMWGVAVPVAVAIIGLASPLLGIAIILYSIGKAVLRALKMLGYAKKNEREKRKEADELRIYHHHYHSQRNPEAFMKLKGENFRQDARERIHREAEEISRQAAKPPRRINTET